MRFCSLLREDHGTCALRFLHDNKMSRIFFVDDVHVIPGTRELLVVSTHVVGPHAGCVQALWNSMFTKSIIAFFSDVSVCPQAGNAAQLSVPRIVFLLHHCLQPSLVPHVAGGGVGKWKRLKHCSNHKDLAYQREQLELQTLRL